MSLVGEFSSVFLLFFIWFSSCVLNGGVVICWQKFNKEWFISKVAPFFKTDLITLFHTISSKQIKLHYWATTNYCWTIFHSIFKSVQCMTKSNSNKGWFYNQHEAANQENNYDSNVKLPHHFNILTFAGSSATREHVWSDARLLGSFGCERISPKYAQFTSNCVTFLV